MLPEWVVFVVGVVSGVAQQLSVHKSWRAAQDRVDYHSVYAERVAASVYEVRRRVDGEWVTDFTQRPLFSSIGV